MRKSKRIGIYRDAKGKIHTLYKDDENYQYINIKGWPITVHGDGSPVDPQQVIKEIEETQAGPWFEEPKRSYFNRW
jgi:hypothetical protein